MRWCGGRGEYELQFNFLMPIFRSNETCSWVSKIFYNTTAWWRPIVPCRSFRSFFLIEDIYIYIFFFWSTQPSHHLKICKPNKRHTVKIGSYIDSLFYGSWVKIGLEIRTIYIIFFLSRAFFFAVYFLRPGEKGKTRITVLFWFPV